MAAVVHLDTHVVVWLYAGDLDRLAPVANRLEGARLAISPMVLLELQYLHEIGRLAVRAEDVVGDLRERIGLRVSQHPFPEVADAALAMSWTRDPFDRLIAAQAAAEGCVLLTADARMLANTPRATWTADAPA